MSATGGWRGGVVEVSLAHHSKTSLISAGDFFLGRVVNMANGIRPLSKPAKPESRATAKAESRGARTAKTMFSQVNRDRTSANASTMG